MGVEAPQEVEKDTDRNDPAVLEENVDRVLLLAQAGLQCGEAEVHDKYEEGCDEHPDIVGEPRGEGIGIAPHIVVDRLVDLGGGSVELARHIFPHANRFPVYDGGVLRPGETGDQAPGGVCVLGDEVGPFGVVPSGHKLLRFGEHGFELSNSLHFGDGCGSFFFGECRWGCQNR